MDIVLAMLADNAAKKIGEKKWEQFPYGMERHAQENENIPNYALYRYIINNAVRYPHEWVINGYGAKVLVRIKLMGNEAQLANIDIIQKSDGLNDETVRHEVAKTFDRAKKDFSSLINVNSNPESTYIILPLEWKIVGA